MPAAPKSQQTAPESPVLDAFAERFADAGLAALVFDYRHFGASDGEPRRLLSIRRQHDDWRAAIVHARATEGIDPDRINMLTFGLGSGIAGIAGVAIGLFAQVTSELGQGWIVQSFMTVVVGGVGNLWYVIGWAIAPR